MTERELRNAEWKERIQNDAAEYCRMIDSLEADIKDRERMNAELAAEIDRLNRGERAA